MEFPPICFEYVLLPLDNKEVALAYSKAEYKEARRNRKSKQSQGDAT